MDLIKCSRKICEWNKDGNGTGVWVVVGFPSKSFVLQVSTVNRRVLKGSRRVESCLLSRGCQRTFRGIVDGGEGESEMECGERKREGGKVGETRNVEVYGLS